MKFASISNSFFKLCQDNNADDELLHNTNRRPYLLIVELKYKGVKRTFALPFRSDISSSTPKDQYFPLPPRPKTKPGRSHGLHYIKMFPISKQYLERFRVDNDPYYQLIVSIINKHEKQIVLECQGHLNRYESDGSVHYAPDIDKIINLL